MPNAVLSRLQDERDQLLSQCDQITDGAEADERDLSDAERNLIARNHARIESEIDPQLEQLEQLEVTRARHQRASVQLPEPVRRGAVELVSPEPDPVVYRTFAQYARDQLIVRYDQIAQRAGPGARQQAEDRISRAVANTLSSDVMGLIPPQYLTQIVEVISTSRPIVESARRIGLTSGQLMYPSIASRPSVGKQTAEKTEAPSSKMTVNFVTVTADTYVGAGDISWQAINWSTPDALQLWFDLAAEAYARQTEAATGTVLAQLATGAPPASDDLAGWMAAIASAAGDIYRSTNRRADTIYADPTTGYHLVGLVSNQSPVFLSTGGFSLSTGSGNIAGLQLVISNGLPAGTVIVGASSALLVAETAGAPVELRAVEPALGGMEVGVIGAFVAKVIDTAAFTKLGTPA
jgi:HK97 family phage major capsid protein